MSDVRRPRVLHLAYGQAAPAALRSLSRTCNVVGLVLPPGADEASTPVLGEPLARLLPRWPCARVSDLTRIVRRERPDIGVICSFDRVLPTEVVREIPWVNVHYAPLPEYRGRAVVNWAIINRLAETAVTIHRVVPDLDAGEILWQQRVTIDDTTTIASLYAALNAALEETLGGLIAPFLDGKIPGVPQNPAAATYCSTRVPADGLLDLTRPAEECAALIRALTRPFPGAFTYYRGRRLTVWAAEVAENPRRYVAVVPGRVAQIDPGRGVDVLTGCGVLRVTEVGLADGHPVPADSIIKSTRDTLGPLGSLDVADLIVRVESLEAAVAKLASTSNL